jgi:hypothetical protein
MIRRGFIALTLAALAGCAAIKPQRGGSSTTTLGGATAPTVVTNAAPENPQTPSTTTVEKTTERDYEIPHETDEGATALVTSNDRQGVPRSEHSETAPSKDVGLRGAPVVAQSLPRILRERTTERATTQTGIAQKDTARELGARLANMRGVMWVGVLLLVAGPIVGWKLGWFTNGCIAGAVGLLLIILSAVIPGNEAWFGLAGLLLIPLVAYAWYHGHHTATTASGATPVSPAS